MATSNSVPRRALPNTTSVPRTALTITGSVPSLPRPAGSPLSPRGEPDCEELAWHRRYCPYQEDQDLVKSIAVPGYLLGCTPGRTKLLELGGSYWPTGQSAGEPHVGAVFPTAPVDPHAEHLGPWGRIAYAALLGSITWAGSTCVAPGPAFLEHRPFLPRYSTGGGIHRQARNCDPPAPPPDKYGDRPGSQRFLPAKRQSPPFLATIGTQDRHRARVFAGR
jgi:hypothetical protein